jgi:antitoxin ChpS
MVMGQTGAKVRIGIERGRLVVEPKSRHRYTLEELLAQCKPTAQHTGKENEWLNSKRVGRELI